MKQNGCWLTHEGSQNKAVAEPSGGCQTCQSSIRHLYRNLVAHWLYCLHRSKSRYWIKILFLEGAQFWVSEDQEMDWVVMILRHYESESTRGYPTPGYISVQAYYIPNQPAFLPFLLLNLIFSPSSRPGSREASSLLTWQRSSRLWFVLLSAIQRQTMPLQKVNQRPQNWTKRTRSAISVNMRLIKPSNSPPRALLGMHLLL